MAESVRREPEDAIDELVVEALARLEDGGESAVEELLGRTEHADVVRERLRTLREVGLVEVPSGETSNEAPERLGEFRLLERIGAGGMGVVYRAVQEPLGREVALKVVRPEQLFFRGARERFHREVETVARLQHPGIVGVHSVGEQDGVPFFAMELVRGKSLEDILVGLEGRDPATLTGRDLDPAGTGHGYLFEGSWEEACVRVIRQVSEALAFAHEGGVLHRDIKPSNVMITSEGTTRALLLDFGLAVAKGSASITRSGSQIGSLRYMASEQVRGDTDRIGPRTDVYGLGVTLYELLANSPAYRGRSDAEILVAIERGDLPRLRLRNPAISWEAETICATATDPDPERRYGSPGDLARDLANALERRPIEARRAGKLLRGRRWVQRRPAAATAVAMGLLVLVGGPLGYAWQQRRSGIVLAAERDTANSLAGLTLEALDRTLTRLGEEDLRLIPQVEPIRQAALEDAVELTERLVALREDDPRAAEEAADAHARLGRLLGELGRDTEAVEAVEAGVTLLARLLRDRPADQALVTKSAIQRIELARTLIGAGRLDEARPVLEAVDAELLERLAGGGGGPDLERLRLAARTSLGTTLHDLDELRSAREMLGEAARESDVLFTSHPTDVAIAKAAVEAWNQYGLLLITKFTAATGADDPELFVALERSLELAEQLSALEPDPWNSMRVVSALNAMGSAHRRHGQIDEALLCDQRGREILEPLVRDFPNTLVFKLELATVHNQLGFEIEVGSRPLRQGTAREKGLAMFAGSEPHYTESVRLLEELSVAAPAEFKFQHRLAIARINLANLRYQVHDDRQGWGALIERSVTAAARAHELAPDHAGVTGTLFNARERLTNVLLSRGDIERAGAVADEMPRGLPADSWKGHSRAAVVHSRCVERLTTGTDGDEAEREQSVLAHIESAVQHARAAIERGMPKNELRQLDALRGAEPFEELLFELGMN